jgi:hypothetical protein
MHAVAAYGARSHWAWAVAVALSSTNALLRGGAVGALTTADSVWRTAQPTWQCLRLFHRVSLDALFGDAASTPSGTCHSVARGGVARRTTALAASPHRACRLGVALKHLQLAAVFSWAAQRPRQQLRLPLLHCSVCCSAWYSTSAAGECRRLDIGGAACRTIAETVAIHCPAHPLGGATGRQQLSTEFGSAARDTAARPAAD